MLRANPSTSRLYAFHAVSDTPPLAHDHCAFEIASNHQSAVAAASNPYGVQVASAKSFSGGYHRASSRSSAFSDSAGNGSVINECSNNNYAPFNESYSFAQRLPAIGIANRYLPDSFDFPNTLRFDTNALLSAQPHAFSSGALKLTNPRYAEGGYGGDPAAHQYYSGPPSYNEHPFAIDTASIGTNTLATRSTSYTNGRAIANNPVPMPVSNNPTVPLDIGLMTEGPFPPTPNVYNAGQASAYSPFLMHGPNNPILPMDMGLTAEGPSALSPNNYTTGQTSANNPLPIPASNSALIPVDIGSPTPQRALCTQCNQDFSRQSDLERHAKKHGPKNIKCQVQGCKYRTYRNDKLGDHMRCRHPAAGSHSN